MTDELNWGQVEAEEEVTERDIQDAGAMGKAPIGKFLTTIDSSVPKQRNPKDGGDSYYVCNLKHTIDRVMEINGEPPTEEDQEKWAGKFIFDNVSLPRKNEPDALKNRRIMILMRAGIISKTAPNIPKDAWSKQILGKQFVVEHVDNLDKKSGKTYRQISFDGYYAPEDVTLVTKDDLSDI